MREIVFDPEVFMDKLVEYAKSRLQYYTSLFTRLGKISTATEMGEYTKIYLNSDLSSIFCDKTIVHPFYSIRINRGKFKIEVVITNNDGEECHLIFSAIMMSETVIADILYDTFGMVPKIEENGFETDVWLRHRFQNLIWETRDISKLVIMVEDPLLKFTLVLPLLEEFLEKTTEYEWPEATMILIRAIHDRKEGRTEEEKPLRL